MAWWPDATAWCSSANKSRWPWCQDWQGMLCVFQGLAVMSLNLLWQARQQRAKSNMTTHARACAHTHTYIQRDVDQTSCNGIKYTWCYKGSCWEVADECLLLHRPVHVSLSHKASQCQQCQQCQRQYHQRHCRAAQPTTYARASTCQETRQTACSQCTARCCARRHTARLL